MNSKLETQMSIMRGLIIALLIGALFNILLAINTTNTYKQVKTQIFTLESVLDQINTTQGDILSIIQEGVYNNQIVPPESDPAPVSENGAVENDDNSTEPETEPEITLSINTTDINNASNLSAEQIDQMINSTLSAKGKSTSTLYGLGSALEKMEKDYNVNALFALSVASLEGSWGNSSSARNKNNPFGIYRKGGVKYFNSTDEAVDYFGRLIRNSYLNKGLTTVSSINGKYCPTNSRWTSDVTSIMKSYASHV